MRAAPTTTPKQLHQKLLPVAHLFHATLVQVKASMLEESSEFWFSNAAVRAFMSNVTAGVASALTFDRGCWTAPETLGG